MKEQDWRDERDSRTLRYAQRRLNPDAWVAIAATSEYVETYAGQVAAITLINLLARMTPSVALDVPAVPIVEPLPWAGRLLPDLMLEMAYGADPYGRFMTASSMDRLRLCIGNEGPFVVHGAGWGSYIGPTESPLVADAAEINPFGAAFAAILAGAHLFVGDGSYPLTRILFDTLRWSDRSLAGPAPLTQTELGRVWSIGVGSVGTAMLFFLTLITRRFSVTLFDHDLVRVHNLDRSPILRHADVGRAKVDAVTDYLREVGVSDIQADAVALHESLIWKQRSQGVPDLVLPAANEYDVR